MVNTVSGYSHALFGGGYYLRKYAEEVDKKEKGGNDNGVIDGDEIQKFKDLVKAKTGYNFDFSGMSQVQNKTIKIQEDDEFLFNNTTEIANKYRNAVTTKTIDWINEKQYGHDLVVKSRKTLDIPFMSDEEFKASVASVDKQEDIVRELIDKQNREIKAKEDAEYRENCKSDFEKLGEWIMKKFRSFLEKF